MPRLPEPKDGYLPFDGGLDEETPAWEIKAGHLVESRNYERGVKGGYVDIEGYERFSGLPAPSDAGYAYLAATLSTVPVALDVVTGATSGASAVVAYAEESLLVITKLSASFLAGEDLVVSAVVIGASTEASIVDGAPDALTHAQYQAHAADVFRADIGPVPGEGPVLGVHMLNDIKYAFRNVQGGASAKMYASSPTGWTEVPLGLEIGYTSGSELILPGTTITGAISGATAVVGAVTIESGSVDSDDAAGRIVFASQTGTFQSETLDIPGFTDVATIASDSSAISLLPGGSYRFYRSAFAGGGTGEKLYGVDGVNRGWEFDGTTFVPISTGMVDDSPDHVVVHRQHLIYAYGPSLQIGSLGDPYSWEVILGAAEIRTDGEITGLKREPGAQGNAVLGVYNRHRLYTLYGTTSADFELVAYRDEVGAFAGTIQQVAFTVFLDDRGIASLKTTQAFGNFSHSTLSAHIQGLIDSSLDLAQASSISRKKNQYRLYYSDGSGLYVTFEGNKAVAMMPIAYNHPVVCAVSQENNSGKEEMYFGSNDGFVYQQDRGTSFDGENILAFLRTHFTNQRVRHNKKFLNPVTIEARGTGYAEIDFSYELGYGESAKVPQPGEQNTSIAFAASGFWDDGVLLWDTLFWDGRALVPTTGLELRGTAENVSFVVRKDSNFFKPVRMTGIHFRYLDRRGMR